MTPRTWDEWIEAFATLFSTPNLKQLSTTTAKQSTDYFPLTVSGLFSRFLTEAKCVAPTHHTPDAFAWEALKITVYENGFLPSIRNEQIREDLARTLTAVRERARNHESDNLHGVHTAS